ncbi:MAG: ParB family transcriptional regulator, chromosome partitioning protein [Betaproteobacteria bacterium]|nr:ParB family transcriptional regulator, chromosome partitioning protein [Betaproteobacteria bacterium]
MATASSAKLKRAPARRPRKQKAGSRGMSPSECVLESLSGEAQQVKNRVEDEGGIVVGAYSDPLGKNPLLLAILPIDRIEPTPFQRDLSQVHHRRLADVIDRTGFFLDPVIAVTAPEKGFWTPNGRHRLDAMRRLGAKSITALVVPKRELAWQILALNTEKAHNLKDKSLEVIRIYRNLMEETPGKTEKEFSYYLEEPSFVTMGLCYEKNPRFSGGVYNSFVRRLTEFSEESLAKTLKRHEKVAGMILELDEKVAEVVKKLKAKGFVSPYLKTFVVARSNPLRFMKEAPELEDLIKTIRGKVERFNVDKIKQSDIVASGGTPDDD